MTIARVRPGIARWTSRPRAWRAPGTTERPSRRGRELLTRGSATPRTCPFGRGTRAHAPTPTRVVLDRSARVTHRPSATPLEPPRAFDGGGRESDTLWCRGR